MEAHSDTKMDAHSAWLVYNPEKNNRCWLDHFVPALEQRMPLIRGPDRLTSLKKISIDAVNDFDIDICLAVGFIHFRCFLCPIDEIDDIPWKFDCGPVNFIHNHSHVDVSIDVIYCTIDITKTVV